MEHGVAMFGLHVLGAEHLPEPVRAGAGPAGAHPTRSLRLAAGAVTNRAAAVRWRSGTPGEGFVVSERPTGEWVLELEGSGRAELSADGCHATVEPTAANPEWPWFVLNQVVGFAATLQGLEVLHASAVEVGGRAVAITAPSGVGKSTLALALVGSGARWMTDDVLALEVVGGRVLAHPGPPIANAAAAGLTTNATEQRPDDIGRRRRILQDPVVDALELGTLVLLDRAAAAPVSVVEGTLRLDDLLGATRNAVVTSSVRLLSLLELFRVAEQHIRVLRVRASDSAQPGTTARLVIAALKSDAAKS